MLLSERVISRVRVFDIIVNLGMHAHLLEPAFPENPLYGGESEPSLRFQLREENKLTFKSRDVESEVDKYSAAIDGFESWLLVILFDSLSLLVQVLDFFSSRYVWHLNVLSISTHEVRSQSNSIFI